MAQTVQITAHAETKFLYYTAFVSTFMKIIN
jgi:hypothetical protein